MRFRAMLILKMFCRGDNQYFCNAEDDLRARNGTKKLRGLCG